MFLPWSDEDDSFVQFNQELDGIVSHIQHARITNEPAQDLAKTTEKLRRQVKLLESRLLLKNQKLMELARHRTVGQIAKSKLALQRAAHL